MPISGCLTSLRWCAPVHDGYTRVELFNSDGLQPLNPQAGRERPSFSGGVDCG